MSNESELIDSKLSIHDLTAHRSLEERLISLNEAYAAQLAELQARVESHLSSYHAPESEERQEEEHIEEEKEEEEKEEEEMSDEDEKKETESEPKPKKVRDKPPETSHPIFKRFTIGGKKK